MGFGDKLPVIFGIMLTIILIIIIELFELSSYYILFFFLILIAASLLYQHFSTKGQAKPMHKKPQPTKPDVARPTPTKKVLWEILVVEIIDQFAIAESDVYMNSSIIGDLGADGMDLMMLLVDLEQKFKTEIRNEDKKEFSNEYYLSRGKTLWQDVADEVGLSNEYYLTVGHIYKYATRRFGPKLMFRRAKTGDWNTVRNLVLEVDRLVNDKDSHGTTILMHAARNGNLEMIRDLLALAADADAENENQSNALVFAAARGHVEIVNALIEAGSDFNIVPKMDLTPLMVASIKGNASIINSLIQAASEVNAKNKNGITAFVNARNTHGRTALMYAIAGGHISIVEMLLSNGANANTFDKYGNNPLSVVPYQ